MAKWDSKNLEIKSKSVELTLVPLVTQVRVAVALTFDEQEDIIKLFSRDLFFSKGESSL